MTLSEAIRLGAMLGPQAFGSFSIWSESGYAYCALGGAMEALGWRDGYTVLALAHIVTGGRPCPAGCEATSSVNMIPHLNDDHRWTREQIADWVASLESTTDRPVHEPVLTGACHETV